jgi:Carboxypeptidase regulatory-like domain
MNSKCNWKREMKRCSYRLLLSSVLTVLFIPLISIAGVLNSSFVVSSVNQTSDLVITQVPLNITEANDTLTVAWTPDDVLGDFYYAQGSPGSNLDDYTLVNNPTESGPGYIKIAAELLTVGQLTCIIQSVEGNSAFFQALIASAEAPDLRSEFASPITAEGGDGFPSITPNFNWPRVPGVPYYLIFVADQPFEIINDEVEGTRVVGANVIWQAITSQLSIQYGIPDPSGTIENEMVPPLVGSMEPEGRTRYNWTVLNCYGNSAEYSSSVVGNVVGFEVEVESPFDPPQQILPITGSDIYEEEILFQWSDVPGATSYLLYLSQVQNYAGGTEVLFPVWRVQTSENAVVCPASSILQNKVYNWKVIAADGQGYGSISDSAAFTYHIESGELIILTRDTQGGGVDLAQVSFEAIDAPGIMPVITDDTGNFTGMFPVGSYILHGSKQGYTDGESSLVTVTENSNQAVTIVMDVQPSMIVGQVNRENSTSVEGATITATSTDGDVFTGTSNFSGEFSIYLESGTYTLVASANGYQNSDLRTVTVSQSQVIDLADNGGPLILTEYIYTLSGAVKNPSGQPIPLAEVIIEKDDQTFSVFTSADGDFTFSVGNGYWEMQSEKPGFYLSSGPIRVLIADEDVQQDIVLNPQAAIISGFVYINSAPSGEDGLEVVATPSAGNIVTGTPSDNGSFTLGVSPGTYSLSALLDGFSGDDVDLVLGPGSTANGLQLHLTANPSSISGRVVTSSADPISQTTVSVGAVSTQSSSSGNYTLTLPAGTHTITASKSGYSTESSGPWTLAYGQDLTGIDIVQSPNVATVSGVISHGGTGIIGANITALSISTGQTVSVTSGNGGSYSVGLIPGNYTITSEKDGFVVLAPESYTLQLQPGAEVTGKNFSLQPNTGIISGTVNDASGPVFSAAITVRKSGSSVNYVSTSTGASGNFNVSVEPGFTYEITCRKQGYGDESITSDSVPLGGEVNVVISLSLLGSSVTGRVSADDGSYINDATVIASGGGDDFSTTTDNNGTYVLSIPPGQYSIDITASGFNSTSGNFGTDPGENLSGLNWALETNYALIAGVVLDVDQNPISSASIVLNKSGGGAFQSTSDNSGFYQFSQVLGGSYDIVASGDGYASQTQNIGVVVDGQIISNADFQLDLLGSGFTGTITSDGNPVSAATVRATLDDGQNWSTVSASNGTYTLDAISSGSYTVEALKAGYTGEAQNSVQISPGEIYTLNLQLTENNGAISGIVSEGGGSVLGGAGVIVESTSTGHYSEAETTPLGQFTVTGLYPLTTYTVSASLEGFGPISQTNVATGTSNINIELERNDLQISGRTVNQVGTTMGYVPIMATSLTDGNSLTTTSDSNGAYTLSEIAKNTSYRIVTTWSQADILDADQTFTTGTTNEQNVDLLLIESTATISGTVGNSSINITAVRTEGGTKNGYSDNDGNYILRGLREGEWIITPSRQGYQITPENRTIADLSVGEDHTGVDFTSQERTVNISGVVRDDGTIEMAEIPVSLLSTGGTWRDTTNIDGSFNFLNVPGYSDYTLGTAIQADGYESENVEFSLTTNDTTGIELLVTVRLGRVLGTVVSSVDDTSIQNFSIQIDDGDLTTYNNSYDVNSLIRGIHNVTVTKAGYRDFSQQFVTDTGTDIDTVNVELVPIQNGYSLFIGHNYTGTEIPLYGAHVILRDSAENIVDEGETSQSGWIQIEDLSTTETYSAECSKPGFETVVKQGIVISAGTGSQLLSPKTNVIFGDVFDEDVSLLDNATIQLKTQNGELREVATDEFGAYELQTFDGASTLIAIKSDDSQTSYLYSIAVSSGEYLNKDLQMRNSATIFGAIETESGGIPASSALIQTENSSSGTYAFQRSNDDGTYRIRGLRPGDFIVSLQADGYDDPDPVELTLAASGEEEVNWVLTGSVTSITGRVTNSITQNGVSGATIDAVGPETLRISTSGDGNYAFTNITPGAYIVTVSELGYEEQQRAVNVNEAEVVAANFEIVPVANQVSGRVYESNAETLKEDAVVILFSGENEIARDTTDINGEWEITISSDGDFIVRPEGSYSPTEIEFTHSDGDGHPGNNFQYVVEEGTGGVSGSVRYGDNPEVQVPVTLQQLGGTNSYQMTTNASGEFSFTAYAPARYSLTAESGTLGTITSSSFELEVDSTVNIELRYANGQIGVTVTDAEMSPVENSTVTISSLAGIYQSTLLTNTMGQVVTDPILENGDYNIEVLPLEGFIPVAPVTVTINNDSVGVAMPLGFNYTPPAIGNVGQPMIVTIAIPSEYVIVSSLLYYQNVGENFFRSIEMNIQETFVKLSDDLGLDDIVIYEGQIPEQSGPGNLAFYPELITDTGLVIGGENTVTTIEISNIGILSEISITPEVEEFQPGVPYLISAHAYDGAGNNLMTEIRDTGTISWFSANYQLEPILASPEDVVYIASGEGVDTIRTTITQPLNGNSIVLNKEVNFELKHRILGELSIPDTDLFVVSGDSITLSIVAKDTGGVFMGIQSEWRILENQIGVLRQVDYTQKAVFTAASGKFGVVKIYAKDVFTGEEILFNDKNGGANEGLQIEYQFSSGSEEYYRVNDGNGVELKILFSDTARSGQDGQLTLQRPRLYKLQKYNTNLEAVNDEGYKITLGGYINEDQVSYTLQLPLPSGAGSRSPRIAKWSIEDLQWVMLGGRVSDDRKSIRLDIDPINGDGISGDYSIIVEAKPLEIESLYFNPNPFSPHGDYPLSIEFTLHSLFPGVWLSIDIYNMVGQKVRTLMDRQASSKGRYARSDGANPPIIWDGLTDDGRWARNGRYLVRIVAEDADGKEEKIDTVVLIK